MIALLPVFVHKNEVLFGQTKALQAVRSCIDSIRTKLQPMEIIVVCKHKALAEAIKTAHIKIMTATAVPASPPFLPPGALAAIDSMPPDNELFIMDFRTHQPQNMPLEKACHLFHAQKTDLLLSAHRPDDHPCQLFQPQIIKKSMQLIATDNAKITPKLKKYLSTIDHSCKIIAKNDQSSDTKTLLFETPATLLAAVQAPFSKSIQASLLQSQQNIILTSTKKQQHSNWSLFMFPKQKPLPLPLELLFLETGQANGTFQSRGPFLPPEATWNINANAKLINTTTGKDITGRQDFPGILEADGRFAFINNKTKLTDLKNIHIKALEVPPAGPLKIITPMDKLKATLI